MGDDPHTYHVYIILNMHSLFVAEVAFRRFFLRRAHPMVSCKQQFNIFIALKHCYRNEIENKFDVKVTFVVVSRVNTRSVLATELYFNVTPVAHHKTTHSF